MKKVQEYAHRLKVLVDMFFDEDEFGYEYLKELIEDMKEGK